MAERALQASIIDYLSALRPTVSDPDGLDVALDVLGEIFSLKTEGDRRHAGSTNLLDAFSKSYVATSAPTAESKDPIEDSPLFRTFLSTITAKGFFGDAAPGSDEYRAKYTKAVAKFKERNPAPEAAPAHAAAAPGDEAGAERAKEEGNAHFKAGRWQQAIEAYSDAIDRSSAGPNSHIYFNNRAAAKTSSGDYAGAAEDAQRALDVEPGFVKAHVRLGTALQFAGRFSDAVSAYEAALRLEPGNKGASDGLAQCRVKAKAGSSMTGGRGASSSAASSSSRPSAGGAGGGGGLGGLAEMLGGAGGLGGLMNNPALAGLMNNPAMQQAAAQMMSNPGAMSGLMSMLGGGGMGGIPGMGGFGGGGGPTFDEVPAPASAPALPAGIPPAFAGLASDPEFASAMSDPELAPIMEEVARDGMGALMRHMGNPKIQRLAQAAMGKMGAGGGMM